MNRSSIVMALAAASILAAAPAAHARKAPDGVSPTEDRVCDVLRQGDYTKGLYGLCVAYCEAEARSPRVLDNYERKRAAGDPEMPCLEEDVPVCPCWTAEMVVSSAALNPVLCELGIPDGGGGRDEAAFIDFAAFDYEFYSADAQGCRYKYDPSLMDPADAVIDVTLPFTGSGEEFACRADLLTFCAP